MRSTASRWIAQSLILMLTLLFCLSTAWALSLSDAKSRGLVGERPDGYLGSVSEQPSSDVQALITDINQQRKQKYREIADRNKTSLQAVEVLAGKTAIKKTEPGNYIQLPSGQWAKK